MARGLRGAGLLAGLVAAAVLGGAVALLLAQMAGSATQAPAPSGTPPARASAPTAPSAGAEAGRTPAAPVAPAPSGGPAAPESGTWIGASVQPQQFTTEGRIAAVEDFERTVGRRLDIVHTYHPWEDKFPSETDRHLLSRGSQLLVSWGGSDTRAITAGRYDDLVRERARAVRDSGSPFFLSWRGEMDRPNLQASIWSPQDYIAAWEHIRAIFREEGATNVAWVWCPTARGFEEGRAGDYYPGDDSVDWLCVDAYPGPEVRSLAEVMAPFLAWAEQHPKPIMIGESGISDRGPGIRPTWLREAAATVAATPRIKAWMYFNGGNPEKGPRAQLSLEGSPESVAAFREVLSDPHFNRGRLPVTSS